MKKILGIVLISLFLIYGNAFGTAGTVTDNGANGVWPAQNNSKCFQVVLTWTDNSTATGTSVPATATTLPINGYVTRVVTDPGGTAPTALYDITLTTTNNGEDIMGGKLADRSATVTEAMRPYDSASGTYGDTYVAGTLILTVTNNLVNSATGTVTIYCERP